MGFYNIFSEEDACLCNDKGQHVFPVLLQSYVSVAFCLQVDDEVKEKSDLNPFSVLGTDNQKLNLLAALLKVDDWKSAEFLLDALEPILPVAYAPIAKAFCDHIHRIIEDVYRRVQVFSNFIL